MTDDPLELLAAARAALLPMAEANECLGGSLDLREKRVAAAVRNAAIRLADAVHATEEGH